MSENESPENQNEELTAQSEEENADELLEEELYADEDEDELMPPEEENEARMLNTGTIIGVIMVGVLVIFLIAFVAMNAGSRKRKQQDSSELDKAGTKTVIEFKDKSPVDFSSGNSEKSDSSETEKSEKEIDDVLETLPAEFQLPQQGEVGTAPVSSVGSRSNYKSDRPDTRNSKSPRKIEGLAALDYSSQDHSFLLIPEGSLLMATYNSSVSYGQKDVQVAWNLLIRPDNYRVQFGNMNGVNAQGASGYRGSVSNHPFETLKALGMIAMFSIIQTEISNDINSQNNEYLKNSMTDVYAEASKMGNKILNKALDIKPTIKIKEGTEIKLITNTPLELPPVEIPAAQERYVRTR